MGPPAGDHPQKNDFITTRQLGVGGGRCVAERGQVDEHHLRSLPPQGPGVTGGLEPGHTGTPTRAGLTETDLPAQGLEGILHYENKSLR